MENIRDIFDRVRKVKASDQITRDQLTRSALADLYAIVERHRLAVGMIFVSPDSAKVLETWGVLSPYPSGLQGTEGIRFIGSGWGADFYSSNEVPSGELIVVASLKILKEALAKGYGVGKLLLTKAA